MGQILEERLVLLLELEEAPFKLADAEVLLLELLLEEPVLL